MAIKPAAKIQFPEDIWEHTLSFLDADTLALAIPLVNKELRVISEREVVWRANLKGLPEKILNLRDLSAKGKCLIYLKEFYGRTKENIKFIVSNDQLEIRIAQVILFNGSQWGPYATTTEDCKKRVFEDPFLAAIKDKRVPLKGKAVVIKKYMENHFFLTSLMKNKDQPNRATLIYAAIRLGCNPNKAVDHFFINFHKITTTPLHAMAYDALFDQRYVAIVQCLLEHGANPLSEIQSQGTPRQFIRMQTTAQLAFNHQFLISFFIPESRNDNLRASHRRIDALLLRYESQLSARAT